MNIQDALGKIISKKDLCEDEMVSVMTQIMEGQIEDSKLGAFLTALKMKGESVSEVVGAAKVMRDKAEKLAVNVDTIVDTCGTGATEPIRLIFLPLSRSSWPGPVPPWRSMVIVLFLAGLEAPTC